jgi:hypothetical protein
MKKAKSKSRSAGSNDATPLDVENTSASLPPAAESPPAAALGTEEVDTTKSIFTLSLVEAQALELSTSQRIAIRMMLSGESLAMSASAAGVTRMTLYRWLNYDAQFQAAYNAWQHDAIVGAQTKLLALADRAVNTVAGAVQNNPQLAFQLLKSLGMTNVRAPGSTDPEEIQQEIEIERREGDARRGKRMMEATLGELGGLRSSR